MNMGLVTSTNRHTALDSDVVFHEYTHGLTNRLVGGPMNDTALDAVQSGGMGEGWSDFFACTMLGKNVVGDWVVNRPLGIRQFRYDDQFPDDFGDLGTGRYGDDNVHAIGEVWCATLLSLSRRLGPWPTAQIVVDALKLTAASPSFLAARDAILLATAQYAEARGLPAADMTHTAWTVFARFGMGPAARTNGATLTGIVADFTAPAGPTTTTTTKVRAEATPDLAIPDNSSAGISSALTMAEAGAVVEVSVTVDITHTYIGDLVVWLVAPDDRSVSLSERVGGSANDLKETWSSRDHDGLAGLRGMASGGTWTLHVVDRARVDTGTLHAWNIEVDVAETRPSVDVVVTPGLTIPDNDAKGITSELVVAEAGTISELRVEVDITHTYVGDLEVTLVTPEKKKIKLQRRRGGDRDNLITEYSSADDGPLKPTVGKPVTGTWALLVVDKAGADVGKLNRWGLHAQL
jgi:extracellular elastinolytic metalloproteinase